MLKKFNVFALALLIIGQTILGPMGTVSAEDMTPEQETDTQAANKDVAQVATTDDEVIEKVEVNKEDLKTLLEEAQNYVSEDYEEASYTAYIQTITAGQKVFDNLNATAEDVNQAVDKIEQAVAALKMKEPEPAKASETESGTNGSAGTESGNDEPEAGNSEAEGASTPENEGVQPSLAPQSLEEPAKGEDEMELFAEAKEIPATLTGFSMKIGDNEVTEGVYSTELPQDAEASFDVIFSVPMQDNAGEAWGDGSWFEFQLPNSLIDFDSAFRGHKTVDEITYTYTTTGNKVKVELEGIGLIPGSDVPSELNIKFKSGFNKLTNDIEQELEIPDSNDLTETIKVKFTFLPTTSNKKVTKSNVGSPSPGTDGNHEMNWVVWVNEAGKQLNNPTLTDNPTGGHEVVADSVNVYQYTVGLNGVVDKNGSGTQVVDNGNWSAINGVLKERNAYKITYKTKVNLTDEKRDGEKKFNNTVTFKNDDQPTETSANAQHTITYGKALEKHNATGKNYTKNWRIDYNHNLLNITKDKATLTDTISGPHDIDFSTIKVYKMNDADGNIAATVPVSGELNSGFTITQDGKKSFKIAFNNAISDAYTITYQSKYDAKDFIEQEDITGQTLNNTVTSGSGKTEEGTYSLTENLLTKNRTVDVNNKTITWTIDIKSDNPAKAISNLTLKDTFSNGTRNGEHKLIGEVRVTGTTGTDPIVNADPDTTAGFTITGINIAAGETATVTYTTSFAIEADGQVATQGYGNTAQTAWTSDGNSYTKTATNQYVPRPTTVNNGSKSGKFNYATREFTWDVKVNINKRDIRGAILVDTVDDGHVFTPDSTIEVLPLTLVGEDDNAGTIGDTPIGSDNYTISAQSETGFTLTFKSDFAEALNNQAYVVRYKTKDPGPILGIGSDTPSDKGNVYTNSATFQTIGDQIFRLVPATVTIDENVANNLITKRNPSQNSTTEKITWTLDVNKSQSDLGQNVKLTDVPGESLWLLEDSVKIATYSVTAGGISNNSDWQSPADRNIPITFNSDGGFELTFPNLENVGYQVRYETIGFGTQGGPLENTAILSYADQTQENQKTEDKFNGTFSFSSSDSSFTSTRGSAKFKKIGIDSETGEIKDEQLEGVQFQLVKKTAKNEYIIKMATTDANGEITFENVPYNNYLIREVAAPTDYVKMNDFAFKLDAGTTLDQNPGLVTELVNVTPLPAGSCDVFTVTVKDVDSQPVTGNVTLTDRNGTATTHTADASGKITLPTNFQAGKYAVSHDTEGALGDVTVKYDGNCETEIQPAPTCTLFTVTINDKDGNVRPNVSVTLKHTTSAASIEETTDNNGKFTVPTSTPTGTYEVYEQKQYLGDVFVTYKGTCEDAVTAVPSCPIFTLTIKDVDGNNRDAGVKITIKDEDGNTVGSELTTNVDGKVTTKFALPAGKYNVFEGNETEALAQFTTNIDCEVEVQPAPTCPLFTITVKDGSDSIRPNVNITITEKDTMNAVATGTTNSDGKISLEPGQFLPAGTYDVYDGNFFIDTIDITYLNGNCEAEVQGAPTCPNFTLTVNDRSGNGRDTVKVVVKDQGNNVVATGDTDVDGKVTFPSVIERGIYTVYEVDANGNERRINSFTVTDTCEAEVKPKPSGGGWVPAPTCDIFTITVKQDGKAVGANTEVILKDSTGKTVTTGKTNSNGKIVFDKLDLSEGSYKSFDKDGKEVGSITVTYEKDKCNAEINLLPVVSGPSCENFTVTVKQSGETVGADVDLTLKDTDGKTIATGKTNSSGKIVFDKADLSEGSYTAYDKNGKDVGTITVTYEEGKCQASIDLLPLVCENFTLTVVDTPNKNVKVKDLTGKTIVSGTTDSNGKVIFPQTITTGEYEVFADGKKISSITVTKNCEATITPKVDPEDPKEEDPDNPTEPEDPTDPTDPTEPGGENPNEPGTPGTPGDPNTPGDNGEVNPGGGSNIPGGNLTPNGNNNGGSNGNVQGSGNNKPGSGNVAGQGGWKDKLPQTGEEQFMYMIALGALLLAAGGIVLFRQRRKA